MSMSGVASWAVCMHVYAGENSLFILTTDHTGQRGGTSTA